MQLNIGMDRPDTAAPPETDRPSPAIEWLIRRWLIVAVVPLVVVALGLYEFSSRRQAERAQSAAAELVAHALASHWRSNDALSSEDLRRACRNMVAHPAILAAAVLNPHGERLVQSARNNDLLPLLHVVGESTPSSGNPVWLSPPKDLAAEFPVIQRVVVHLGPQFKPDRPERLVLLMGEVDPTGAGQARWWFWVVVPTTAFVGLLLAGWVLRRRIVEPVTRLMTSASTHRLDVAVGDLPEETDEFGLLARSLNGLKEETFHWRGQAERVERRMALQIASQTREISRDLRRFQREAWLDPLTRLKNRRLLDEQLPTVFASHRDAGLDLSVVMLDLDHFKRLNDQHGHQAGDEILIFVGELFTQCLRADDIAVRYGGDEFVLILPGISAEDAASLTKRLIALFNQRVKVMFDGQAIPGMTAGIASLANNQPPTPNSLLAAADRALYQAKKSGRGCVQICRSYERMTA